MPADFHKGRWSRKPWNALVRGLDEDTRHQRRQNSPVYYSLAHWLTFFIIRVQKLWTCKTYKGKSALPS